MFHFRKTLAATAAALGLALAALPAAAHDGVHINQPYARLSAQSGAVFMVIVNHAAGDDRLVAAAAPDVAQAVELHTHKEDANGVMQMMAVPEGFVIPGHGEHALARGGDHVMLMGLKQKLKDGDSFTMTLTFENAGEITVDVPVDNNRDSADAMPGMDMQGHDHSAHAAHGNGAAVDTTGMTDDQAVAAVMMAQFDTPETPLTVDPVVVEGDFALASWAQGDKGGRALLQRRDGQWVIVLCGGPDLRMPAFLTEHGVSDADRLSAMFNAAEDGRGEDKVKLWSSFEGVVMISEPATN